MASPNDSLLILHFNDVYNIDARDSEPVGGAARFQTKLKSFQDRNPLKFFCGDAFNPSVSEYLVLSLYGIRLLSLNLSAIIVITCMA